MRERQPLVVPGWTLSFEDLMFFLDVKRTGNAPAIYLEAGEAGLTAERTRGRQSALRVRFGLEAEVEALRDTELHAGSRGPLKKGDIVICRNHERLAMNPASASRSTSSGARPPNPAGASAWPATARNIWFPTTPPRCRAAIFC